jgi:superfamily II DNA or RNA helicase
MSIELPCLVVISGKKNSGKTIAAMKILHDLAIQAVIVCNSECSATLWKKEGYHVHMLEPNTEQLNDLKDYEGVVFDDVALDRFAKISILSSLLDNFKKWNKLVIVCSQSLYFPKRILSNCDLLYTMPSSKIRVLTS